MEEGSKRGKLKIGIAAALVLMVAAGAVGALQMNGDINLLGGEGGSKPSDEQRPAVLPTAVIATVNGLPVTESEVAPIMAQGADRAVAVDRYINKVLAAEAGQREYSEEAKVAIRAAEREVLAQLYLRRKSEDLAKSFSEDKLREYYEKNVKDEDYAQFKLRYYLSQDQNDAARVRDLADKGDRDALAKFAPVKKGDEYSSVAEIPYGLGQVVKRAKTGEKVGPVMVRDGLLILIIDDVKKGERPKYETVKEEIRSVLVSRQLNDILTSARKSASITLN
ncbi:MAG: hypothetical protein RIR70_302 [Pseudomonadota bacterium]|jgi:peptidyl-prolyl cis-trans isomerase C